ncbi:MAG TPA: HAD family hydrolase [Candidatus Acidoferrales bacterium]|nr:HAD family hydrolase [Candidatus Acidoferrales bacterium]
MRAVFFDRDGTLMEEAHYCGDPAKVRVYPGVAEALRRLKRAGFGVFVISNQSGIGRGIINDEQYHAVQAEFLRQIGPGLVDDSYYCPDAPGTPSACRKPEPGMVLRAAAEHGIELTASFFVGDREADVECGRRAGTRTILVRTGYGAGQTCTADWVCADAVEAIEVILALVG